MGRQLRTLQLSWLERFTCLVPRRLFLQLPRGKGGVRVCENKAAREKKAPHFSLRCLKRHNFPFGVRCKKEMREEKASAAPESQARRFDSCRKVYTIVAYSCTSRNCTWLGSKCIEICIQELHLQKTQSSSLHLPVIWLVLAFV